MRTLVLTVATLSLFGTAALAQGEPAQSGPSNAAIKSMDENNSSMPVAGANSFTESQAKSHIEAKGYTNVTSLQKDEKGVWRGIATKNGQSGPVTLDYQGNVN
jgi:hypothetical protein